MQITNDIFYVGVNDHNVDLFEGQYVVPNGMAYNSYVIMDEFIAVMDTVDARFTHEWLDNGTQVQALLKKAAEEASYVARRTLSKVQEKLGFVQVR